MHASGQRNKGERVGQWKMRLDEADTVETTKIRDEKSVFFAEMRKNRPDLYAAFRMDEKTLSETIIKKLTGKNEIID